MDTIYVLELYNKYYEVDPNIVYVSLDLDVIEEVKKEVTFCWKVDCIGSDYGLKIVEYPVNKLNTKILEYNLI